ncbi:MAG: hypothetical protein KIT84_27195 [Labilithrix sp.]|nr:hypothetical protein [Labilithrix sp.]MCW5814743.1 hypothetical protein [Labilithrix sp.]
MIADRTVLNVRDRQAQITAGKDEREPLEDLIRNEETGARARGGEQATEEPSQEEERAHLRLQRRERRELRRRALPREPIATGSVGLARERRRLRESSREPCDGVQRVVDPEPFEPVGEVDRWLGARIAEVCLKRELDREQRGPARPELVGERGRVDIGEAPALELPADGVREEDHVGLAKPIVGGAVLPCRFDEATFRGDTLSDPPSECPYLAFLLLCRRRWDAEREPREEPRVDAPNLPSLALEALFRFNRDVEQLARRGH